MTLILKLGLDMVKMYLHTKNEVSMSRGSKIIAWTDRNTDRQRDRQTDMTENITYPHTQVVIREIFEKNYCIGHFQIKVLKCPDLIRVDWFTAWISLGIGLCGHFRIKVRKCPEPLPRAGNSTSNWGVQNPQSNTTWQIKFKISSMTCMNVLRIIRGFPKFLWLN